jgi:hypothetical protein
MVAWVSKLLCCLPERGLLTEVIVHSSPNGHCDPCRSVDDHSLYRLPGAAPIGPGKNTVRHNLTPRLMYGGVWSSRPRGLAARAFAGRGSRPAQYQPGSGHRGLAVKGCTPDS